MALFQLSSLSSVLPLSSDLPPPPSASETECGGRSRKGNSKLYQLVKIQVWVIV